MGILSNLMAQLKTGEATFMYRKSNGRIRKARGTINKQLIPHEDWNTVKNPFRKTDESSLRIQKFVTYYDLDAGEWRRFKVFSLVRLFSFRPLNVIKQTLIH